MNNKIQNIDNQLFINLVEHLNLNFNFSNKFIAEKIGIKAQRISDMKFGTAIVLKKELNDLQEIFAEDLKGYVEPLSNPKKAKNIDNETFINFTEHLLKVKRLSLEDIAVRLDAKRLKIANIRTGRSSADRFMLSKIKEVFKAELEDYKELQAITMVEATEYAKKVEIEQQESKIERLEREIEQLKVLVFDNFKRLQKLEEE